VKTRDERTASEDKTRELLGVSGPATVTGDSGFNHSAVRFMDVATLSVRWSVSSFERSAIRWNYTTTEYEPSSMASRATIPSQIAAEHVDEYL
jgi:hypothetical protein